jgi:hypothetical protein
MKIIISDSWSLRGGHQVNPSHCADFPSLHPLRACNGVKLFIMLLSIIRVVSYAVEPLALIVSKQANLIHQCCRCWVPNYWWRNTAEGSDKNKIRNTLLCLIKPWNSLCWNFCKSRHTLGTRSYVAAIAAASPMSPTIPLASCTYRLPSVAYNR